MINNKKNDKSDSKIDKKEEKEFNINEYPLTFNKIDNDLKTQVFNKYFK